jgi:hypothetical protein
VYIKVGHYFKRTRVTLREEPVHELIFMQAQSFAPVPALHDWNQCQVVLRPLGRRDMRMLELRTLVERSEARNPPSSRSPTSMSQ